MDFGAIIGVCELTAVIHIDDIESWLSVGRREKHYAWLRTHAHVEGPLLWIVENSRRLERPIPYRGDRGLWTVRLDERNCMAEAA